jgi:Fe-S cluster assembly protein SufD
MATVVKTKSAEPLAHEWVQKALDAAQVRRGSSAFNGIADEARGVWQKVLFPTPRLEAWKYTDTDAIAKGEFSIAKEQASSLTVQDIAPFVIPDLSAYLIVFVNGVYCEPLSNKEKIAGVSIERLAAGCSADFGVLGQHRDESFAALSTALTTDALAIEVSRGAVVARPFHVINVVTPEGASNVIAPRLLIKAHEQSQVTVVESCVSTQSTKYLSLPVVEIVAADAAIVDYYKFQDESREAYHISSMTVEQGRSGSVSAHIFSFGGALVRNNVNSLLKGSGAMSVLNGLSVLSGTQHVDNTTLIHHIEPTIESREHFKGIYADESRGVFSGTITVDQIAQKTNAFQSNQALLLSPSASIETRPQLKIWADDVKCTHGATVGQLDDEAMFYLRSRGVGRDEARGFLIHAFASEVLTTCKVEPLRQYVEAAISKKLGVVE